MSLTLKDLRVVGRWLDPTDKTDRIIREVRIADIVEVLKSEGAEVAELGTEHFYWEADDHLDAPGRYLVFRLDEEE